MEENTNTNLNNFSSGMSTVSRTSAKYFSKKKIIIFGIIIVIIGFGVGYYFFMKKEVEPYKPTLEEKVKAVEETVNKTKELGLPAVKKQVDIMNYNLQQ